MKGIPGYLKPAYELSPGYMTEPSMDNDGNEVPAFWVEPFMALEEWVPQTEVPFTEEEEVAADAAEAAWIAGAPLREIDARLIELDARLPRAIEDVIGEGAYLYPVKQEKEALRADRRVIVDAASG